MLGELILPPGLACSSCNWYFGQGLDPALARHPYVLQWRAVYGKLSRPGANPPVYEDRHVRIETTPSGVLIASGGAVELDRRGNLRVPRPSLEGVDHFLVSRAIHRAALEHELIRIAKKRGVAAARDAAGRSPLQQIARYVRAGHRRDYRPYGVEGHGGTMANPAPFDWEVDPRSPLISPPAFTGFIIPLPGARFSCTLAEDPDMLAYMLARIEETEASAYMTTRHVFWTPRSGGIRAR